MRKGNNIHDDDIYATIRGPKREYGCSLLYAKYWDTPSKSIPLKYGCTTDEAEDIWQMSLIKLYQNILANKITKQAENPNWLLPILVGIAKYHTFNNYRKKSSVRRFIGWIMGIPPAVVPEHDIDEEDVDYLILHCIVEHMAEPERTILLLKYFPENPVKPEEKEITDEEISDLIKAQYQGVDNKNKLGVYRRRGIVKMKKIYDQLSARAGNSEEALKTQVEKIVGSLAEHDRVFIHINYPASVLMGKMVNQGHRFPENERVDHVKRYIFQQKNETGIRLRLYPEHAMEWLKKIPETAVITNKDTFYTKLKGVLGTIWHKIHTK